MDDTRRMLIEQAKKDSRFLVLCDHDKEVNLKTCKLNKRSVPKGGNKEINLEHRVKTLGRFRQVYWNYIQTNLPDYEYLCVLDWDLEGQLSVPGFFHGLHYLRSYADVIACNSFYKDRHSSYEIHDTYPLLNENRCEYLSRHKAREDNRMKEQMRDKVLYQSSYPVPVGSAFGGLALYHIARLCSKNASYENPSCPIECEHTTFHRNLQVFIDPWMTLFITKNRH
jgi:hypothetical protein